MSVPDSRSGELPEPYPQVSVIGALADPLRRRLYQFITEQRRGVTREEAAVAIDIPTSKAKFHLDRLAEEGLLEYEYHRVTGRTGPGAGRPAKMYYRSQKEFTVSLPTRRYDLMGKILASAFDRTVDEPAPNLVEAVNESAYREGVAVAAESTRHPEDNAEETATVVLSQLGYEAANDSEEVIRLGNCPFDALAREHRDLVCAANQHFVQGVLDESGCYGAQAALEPNTPDSRRCCVAVHL